MDVDISITQNGKKNHIHETITNDELENMLHKETSPVPLEDRLREDFLVDNRVYRIEKVPLKTGSIVGKPLDFSKKSTR